MKAAPRPEVQHLPRIRCRFTGCARVACLLCTTLKFAVLRPAHQRSGSLPISFPSSHGIRCHRQLSCLCQGRKPDWVCIKVFGSDVNTRGSHCAGAQQRAARGGAGGRILSGGLRKEALGRSVPGRGWLGAASCASTGAPDPRSCTTAGGQSCGERGSWLRLLADC